MSKPRKFSIPGKNNRITPNNSVQRAEGFAEPQSAYATLGNIPDDNDDYSITPLSEEIDMPDYGKGSCEAMNPTTNSVGDLRSPEEFDNETRFFSTTTSNMIFEENNPKKNNIWTIVRANVVNLSKQIFKVICDRIITRNSEKYLDILSIRSPSWELYARKNKLLRTISRCSNDKLKNYVTV